MCLSRTVLKLEPVFGARNIGCVHYVRHWSKAARPISILFGGRRSQMEDLASCEENNHESIYRRLAPIHERHRQTDDDTHASGNTDSLAYQP